jgi:hypothetical protein
MYGKIVDIFYWKEKFKNAKAATKVESFIAGRTRTPPPSPGGA